MLIMIAFFITFVFGQIITHTPDIPTLHAIVRGPISGIKYLDPDILLYNLKFLQRYKVAEERRWEVFMRIKGKRRLDEMKFAELRKMGVFVKGVSSHVLRNELDCKKDNLMMFLGRAKLKKKLLGVLAQCLKKEFGKQVYLDFTQINKYCGIICGYGVEELSQIDDNNFFLIVGEVFVNLDRCNNHQLQALYNIAVKPTVYGIPQGWNKRVVRSLGSLITMIPLYDLNGMSPMAFSEVKAKVLRHMTIEKLQIMMRNFHVFRLRSKNEIWRIMGIPSNSKMWDDRQLWILCLLVFLFIS